MQSNRGPAGVAADDGVDEEDEEQHSEGDPLANPYHVGIKECAAYYLQVRDPSPDDHRCDDCLRMPWPLCDMRAVWKADLFISLAHSEQCCRC